MLIILAAIFGGFAIFTQLYTYLGYKKTFNEQKLIHKDPFKVDKANIIWLFIQIAQIIFGVGLAYFYQSDVTIVAVALVIVLYAISSIFTYLTRRQLTYNNKGFIYLSNFYYYSDVTTIAPRPFGIGMYNVYTLKGDELIFSKKHALMIEQLSKKKKSR